MVLRVLLAVGVAGLLGVGSMLLRASAPASGHSASIMTAGAACKRRERLVRVGLSRARWPHVADHVADVAGTFPRRLHIGRAHADDRRAESLRGIPTRPGMDRDEYPPAMAREGGAGADVRYAPSSENRSAGASMGARLEPWCNGQAFRLVPRP